MNKINKQNKTIAIKHTLLVSLLIFFTLNYKHSFSQECKIDKYVFSSGEKVNYTVYYNLGFIWLKAGKVTFEVKDTIINKKAIWRFISKGKTLPGYDWIFSVDDYFQSWVLKNGFKPLYYSRNTQEGNFYTKNSYTFSLRNKLIYTKLYNSDKGKRIDTIKNENCLFDVLSATYYTRCINFSYLKKNDTFTIKTIMDGEKVPIKVKYYGIENIKHKNDKTYRCYHFSTSVVEGNIFKAGQEIHVWVEKSDKNIPVLIKADILVGSVMVFRDIK
jgi:hypothetical protein